MTELPRIAVCICTYRRVRLLGKLLEMMDRQEGRGTFEFSLVVVDNDHNQSARATVEQFAVKSRHKVVYAVEARQNIALARNLAVNMADTDWIAFFDDDQFPSGRWLLTLFEALKNGAVDGVLGPVLPHYEQPPPAWVLKGKVHERARYPTGYVIDWPKGRTGNVLLSKKVVDSVEGPFDPAFLTGEDQDFFRRAIAKGGRFIWCDEAVAYETVPPVRWNWRFMVRRALLRGQTSLEHPSCGTKEILRSIVALPTYVIALPLLWVCGRHHFMKYLVKCFDHAGRLLAALGMRPVKETYVTE
jgi:GT2 family glycosyltransferase